MDLDRRYAAGEGAEHADVINVLAEGYAAMNRRDFDVWAAIHTPDHTSHDHSLIGFGEIGMQTYRDYLLAALEQVPDFVFVPATFEIDALVALVTIPVRGATPTGFEFERDMVVVTRFGADLRIVEDHFFDSEQWPEARALFEALAAASTSTRAPRGLRTRDRDRIARRGRARRRRSLRRRLRRCSTDDLVRHRSPQPSFRRTTANGRDEYVASAAGDLRGRLRRHLRSNPLAVRGDRLPPASCRAFRIGRSAPRCVFLQRR